MDEKRIRRSIYIQSSTIEKLERISINNGVKVSETIRRYIDDGLQNEVQSQSASELAKIVSSEMNAVLNIDDIKSVVEKNTERMAKMLMKIGKLNAGQFFVLLSILSSIDNTHDRFELKQITENAIKAGVDYMQKKDFQINDFLEDIDNLYSMADKIGG